MSVKANAVTNTAATFAFTGCNAVLFCVAYSYYYYGRERA